MRGKRAARVVVRAKTVARLSWSVVRRVTATSPATPAYSRAMNTVTASVNSRPQTFILSWRRVLLTVCVSLVLGGMGSLGNSTTTMIVLGRYLLVGVSALLAFGIFERWPARTRLPRWALQQC